MKKVYLFSTLIENKATIRYYADRKLAPDGSIITPDAADAFETSLYELVPDSNDMMRKIALQSTTMLSINDISSAELLGDDGKRQMDVSSEAHINSLRKTKAKGKNVDSNLDDEMNNFLEDNEQKITSPT